VRADAVGDHGGTAIAVQCDVARIGDVDDLAAQAQSWFDGPPTLVVNNAGIGAGGQMIGEIPLADWSWTLGVNLWGPIHGCHVFTPILRAAGRGGVINVASAASFGAAPAMAAYNVSKAAVLSLSETLAAYDRGGLYCMPALDAKIGWGIKRVAPTTFTRTAGLVTRIGSAVSS
jgi:NAD(P)-dependent dehydrogenase (short-subunit alcohol dehydrogenase family)